MTTIRKVMCFLRFVWRSDFMGDPISIRTAWVVAGIYHDVEAEEKP
jgi:hypothetical protein